MSVSFFKFENSLNNPSLEKYNQHELAIQTF